MKPFALDNPFQDTQPHSVKIQDGFLWVYPTDADTDVRQIRLKLPNGAKPEAMIDEQGQILIYPCGKVQEDKQSPTGKTLHLTKPVGAFLAVLSGCRTFIHLSVVEAKEASPRGRVRLSLEGSPQDTFVVNYGTSQTMADGSMVVSVNSIHADVFVRAKDGSFKLGEHNLAKLESRFDLQRIFAGGTDQVQIKIVEGEDVFVGSYCGKLKFAHVRPAFIQ